MRRAFQLTVSSLLLISAGCQYGRTQLANTEAPAPLIPVATDVGQPVNSIDQASATEQPLAEIPSVPGAEEYESASNITLPSPRL